MYHCSYGSNCNLVSDDALQVTNHMKLVHGINEKGDTIKCIGSRNCDKLMNTLTSTRLHARNHHQNVAPIDLEATTIRQKATPVPVLPSTSSLLSESFASLSADSVTSNESSMYLLLKAYHGETEAFFKNLVVNGVNPATCDEINRFIQSSLDYTENLLKNNLSKPEEIHIIETVINKMKRPLIESKSDYLRKKKIHLDPFYIKPRTIAIAYDTDLKRNFKFNEEKSKTADFEMIPITETLKKKFQNEAFRKAYMDSDHICEVGKYKSSCCGAYFKLGAFSRFENCEITPVRIQLYSDGVTINAGYNKDISLTFFYMSIRNIPDCYLSQSSNIDLVAVCKTADLNNEIRGKGKLFNKVMKHIVEDLKQLEAGISISYTENDKQITKTLKGSIFTAVNDNLGYQEMLGLAESFNATYFNRFSYVTREMSKHLTSTAKAIELLRPSGSEYYQPFINAKNKMDVVETRGITSVSALCSLEFYSVVDSLSVDPFHDLPEGVIPLVLKKFFEQIISQKALTLDAINSRLLGYDYGNLDRGHRPSIIILENATLGQGGMQLLNLLFRVLFIFDDLILTHPGNIALKTHDSKYFLRYKYFLYRPNKFFF